MENNNENICNYSDVKSHYILEIIFNNLNEMKLLNIIRYNKNIKNILDKNIIDYKNCLKIEIEIEVENIKNKENFININNEEYNLFEFYNSDTKEKILNNYITEKEKKITILIDYDYKNLSDLFKYCKYIKKVNFIIFNRKDIVIMRSMFDGCSSLKELNINNFNTNNVTDMSGMFGGCSSLEKLNHSNFNTSNVKDMSIMFRACEALKALELSNFNTNNVSNMREMFSLCKSLKVLNLSSFNTNEVTDMYGMFQECSSL